MCEVGCPQDVCVYPGVCVCVLGDWRVSGGGCVDQEGVARGMYTPQTPPPVNRMTDRCKNINFPQLRLR